MVNKVIYSLITLTIIGGGLFYWYSSTSSEPDVHTHSVYLVNPGGPAYDLYFDTIQTELEKSDLHDSDHINFSLRDANGDPDLLKKMVTEAVSANPDVIVTVSSQPTKQALKESNGLIPILSTLGDPVAHGYVESLKGSGKNLSGVAQQNIALTPKRLELLKELDPDVTRVAIFYDTTCGPTKLARPIANELASKIGLTLTEFDLTNPTRDELEEALQQVTDEDYDALMFYPHGTLFSKSDLFLDRAVEEGLPIIMPNEEAVARGATGSYGPSYEDMGKLMARLTEKVLSDETDVSELPWEQPSNINYLISESNAKGAGIKISPAVQSKANLVK